MLNKSIRLCWLVVVTVVLISGLSFALPQNADTDAISAQVVVVREQPLPIFATFPGRVDSTNEVQVASRLMGYVKSLPVHEGQLVPKGALLLSVDDSDVKGAISQAQAGVATAESVLAEAIANYKRFSALYQQQAIPQQQFQQVEMAYLVAQGNRDAARAALVQAQAQLHYVDIRAPFAGTVVARFVDPGQLIAPGQPLMTLQSAGCLQVVVQVSQHAFEQLRVGQEVPVSIEGSNYQAQQVQTAVARLVAAADPVTHSHSVKLNLPAGSSAGSGDFARVQIQVGTQHVVVLPQSAIQRRAGIDGVFVVNRDGTASFRMVRLGERSAAGVTVLAGVVTGEVVVVRADGELNNGVKVQISAGDSV